MQFFGSRDLDALRDAEVTADGDQFERPLDLIDINWLHPCATKVLFSTVVDTQIGGINFANGEQSTQVGSPTFTTRQIIGTAMASAGGNNYMKWANTAFASPSNITFAAILILDSSLAFGGILADGTSGSWCLNLTAAGNVLEITTQGVAEFGGGPTLATGVPYFVAASRLAGSTVNYLARRLDTGLISTTTISNASAAPSNSSGGVRMGSEASGGWNGAIAAGAIIYDYFSMAQLLDWADDPWGFWKSPLDDVVGMQAVLVGGSTFGQVCSFSQAVTAGLTRQIGKVATLSGAEALSLSRRTAKTIVLTQAQQLSLIRAAGKLVLPQQAEAVTVSTLKVKTVNAALTSPETATLRRSAGKITLVSSPGAPSLLKTVGKPLVAVTQPQVVTLTPIKAKNVPISTIVSGQAVTLTRGVGKIALVAQAELATLQRSVGHNIAAQTPQTVTLVRGIGKILATLLSGETVTLNATKSSGGHNLTLTISSSEQVTLARSTGKQLVVGMASAATLSRAIGKQLSSQSTEAVTLTRSIGKILTKILSPEVVTESGVKGKSVVPQIAQGSLLTLQRMTGKTIAVTLGEAVTAAKRMSRRLTVAQASALVFSAQKTHLKTFSVTLGQVVSLLSAIFTALRGVHFSNDRLIGPTVANDRLIGPTIVNESLRQASPGSETLQ